MEASVTGAVDPSSPLSSAPPSRWELIRTAVIFLKSPRVISASEEKKRLFLKSKSLSDEEVRIALDMAADPLYRESSTDDGGAAQPLQITTASALTRWGIGGVGVTLAVFAGLSYGLHILYLRYVLPFLRRQKRTDEKLATLEESVRALQDNVNVTLMKMQASVEKLEASFRGQTASTMQMEARLKQNHSQLIAEVKSEVTSLKGVLLDVKNFPAPKLGGDSQVLADSSLKACVPTTCPPTWQLQPPESSSIDVGLDLVPVSLSESVPCVSSSVIDDNIVVDSVVVVEEESTPSSIHANAAMSGAHGDVGNLRCPQTQPPPSSSSRSASSSGSSATSFEVIESKDCGSVVIGRKGACSGGNLPEEANGLVESEEEEGGEEEKEQEGNFDLRGASEIKIESSTQFIIEAAALSSTISPCIETDSPNDPDEVESEGRKEKEESEGENGNGDRPDGVEGVS